jgi:hypothetical protein
MPGSSADNDHIRTFTSEGDGKSRTTKIAPLEIGRDEAPLRLASMQETDPSTVREPPSGVRLLHMDDSGDLVRRDPGGGSQNVTSPSDLATLTGSPVPVGSGADLQLDRGQRLQDAQGNDRLDFGVSNTVLRNDAAKPVVSMDSGSRVGVTIRAGERFDIFDAQGGFLPLQLNSSSTPPSTLSLSNAELDMAGNGITDSTQGFIDVSNTGVQFPDQGGGTQPAVFVDNAGEVVARDDDGNTTQLT